MGSTFSTDQQSVIDARGSNILVSAAAGSGKTSVLTERIVGLVSDVNNPVDIDRILVVTFTNAAAREMKERIGKRLNSLIMEHPGDAHLEKQATLIHGAQITTIDSFCLFLVKNHFHRIGLDPAFRIAGQGEIKLLKQEVLKDVIKKAYESHDERFYHVVDCYSKKDNDDSLENSIEKLFEYSMSHPWPEKWLDAHKNDYLAENADEFENSSLFKSIREKVKEEFAYVCSLLEEAFESVTSETGPRCYEENIKNDLEYVKSLIEKIESESWNVIKAYMDSFAYSRLSTKKCECDPEEKERIKNTRNFCKDRINSIKERFFYDDIQVLFADMQMAGENVSVIIDLVKEFMQRFEAEKRARGIIDFADMEHMAVKILIEDYTDESNYTITDVARGYRDYFKEVMVDEYQDSNLVQELIIQSVSKEQGYDEGNRFMVGDVKQSIYRFRMARPEIFMGKAKTYRKGEGEKNRLITLKQNFRSRKSVIDTVNLIFEDIMGEKRGGVVYDDDARLYHGAPFNEDSEEDRTELVLVKRSGNADKSRDEVSFAIADKIKSLVGTMPVYDVKTQTERMATYKDIAVLFRAPTKWRDNLKRAFEEYTVPYKLDGVGSFYNSTEISEVISLLRVINNPLDDISLYASLTSHFGGLTDEECALIKGYGADGGRFLWDKARAFLAGHENEKLFAFVKLIDKYRFLAEVLPIHELISRLFEESGYKYIVSAMPDGEKRLANVEMLIVKACEYGKTSFYGLFHFIQYLELIKKIDEDEGEANTFDENSDLVQIMSIHGSKGLEFPITIVAGIEEEFNLKDLSKEFVTDMDEGIGANAIDPEKRTKKTTLKRNFIALKAREESIGEEIRILYVALTRAKEKLILVASEKDPENWLDSAGDMKDTSYLSLIKNSLLKHKGKEVDVTITSFDDINVNALKRDVEMVFSKEDLISNAGNPNPVLLKKLKERFGFKYPFENLSTLYTKTTVSELKMASIEKEDDGAHHPFEENEPKEAIPLFAGGEVEVKGTDRGTAYHSVMELLCFKNFLNTTDIKDELSKQLNRIVEEKSMSSEDVSKVDKRKLLAFLESDTAREMMEADAADMLFKEQPFVIGVPASSVEEGFPEEETLLVQGVIDVYYIKDSRITVLDYKTDRVSEGSELIKRYRKQLYYYADAINQLTGLEVSKKVIYSFGLQSIFMVD